MPNKYVSSIKNDIKKLSELVVEEYDSTSWVLVSSMRNSELRSRLINLKVDYIDIRYRYDSTKLTKYQLQYFDREYTDSLIVFGQYKRESSLGLDPWKTRNEVSYYYGVDKPNIKTEKGKFSNYTKRLNDSMTFERIHYPIH